MSPPAATPVLDGVWCEVPLPRLDADEVLRCDVDVLGRLLLDIPLDKMLEQLRNAFVRRNEHSGAPGVDARVRPPDPQGARICVS